MNDFIRGLLFGFGLIAALLLTRLITHVNICG